MHREDLVYKDECYRVVGVLFDIFRELGGNLLEKHYQKAVAIALKKLEIKFTEQFPIKLYYEEEFIGIFYADFFIEIGNAHIILEIKKDENFGIQNVKQTNQYIQAIGVKLGILANFTKSGVKYKRIVNLK